MGLGSQTMLCIQSGDTGNKPMHLLTGRRLMCFRNVIADISLSSLFSFARLNSCSGAVRLLRKIFSLR